MAGPPPHPPARQLELIAAGPATHHTSENNHDPLKPGLGQARVAAWLPCVPALREEKLVLVLIK